MAGILLRSGAWFSLWEPAALVTAVVWLVARPGWGPALTLSAYHVVALALGTLTVSRMEVDWIAGTMLAVLGALRMISIVLTVKPCTRPAGHCLRDGRWVSKPVGGVTVAHYAAERAVPIG